MQLPTTPAVRLHRVVNGDGPPVIVMHGLFGAGSNLATLSKALQPRWRVYRPDLRNHGQSPSTDAIGYAEMASDVVALMDDEHLERTALVGHSMGGKVAMELALRYPARVAALVVADIAPIAYPPDRHDAIFRAFAAVADAGVGSRAEAGRLMEQYIADDATRAFLLTNLVRDGDRYRWRLPWRVLEAGQPALARAQPEQPPFDGPVLFIMGSRSEYYDPADRDAVLGRFPNARFKLIDRAGHWLHAEAPVAFNRLVNRFLEQHYTPPAATS